MTLVPCPRCRRHVLADDHACPFCGLSRWSRIAVLAGALALPGCWREKPAAQPPAPVEHTTTTEAPVEQSFPRVATAKITGIVTNTRTSSPLVGDLVYLVGPDGDERHVATDENGRYEFGSLVAGDYFLRVHVDAHRQQDENVKTAGDRITVKVGETVEHDVSTYRMDPRAKMPYGAPPARSRVV
ncbi:MAG: hypothetical protein HOV81_16455 [Kofleriaceae bacterium]|nr:hypothetical protein [Kofleriaceae bacterium]